MAHIPHPHEFQNKRTQQAIFLVGQSGAGKHWHVNSLILDYLARGEAVVVLDAGNNFDSITQVVGGTVIRLLPDGQNDTSKRGCSVPATQQFVIYDFEGLPADGGPHPALQVLLKDGERRVGGLVVVDETYFVAERVPNLRDLLASLAEASVSICVTGQCDEDINPYLNILPRATTTIRLSRMTLAG